MSPDESARLEAILIRDLRAAAGDHPKLPQAIRDALARRPGWVGELEPMNPDLPAWLAAEIEDYLTWSGDPLDRHLNNTAMADWSGIVMRRFARVAGAAKGAVAR